jgi:hypothetical protein
VDEGGKALIGNKYGGKGFWDEAHRFFLNLDQKQGGRGNFGMLHQQVYPKLAEECLSSGTGWDQARELEEGRRLRKLRREIENWEI